MRMKTILPIVLILSLCWVSGCRRFLTSKPDVSQSTKMHILPAIYPDWHGTKIPPNIAPLNFKIIQPADAYFVLLTFADGSEIDISSSKPAIQIPMRKWKKYLQKNAGAFVSITVSAKSEKKWKTFANVEIAIAKEGIDSHLAYRLIKPLYVYWDQMGLYQRDLTSFKEKPIFLNRTTDSNCINCHSFCKRQPDKMLFHMRAGKTGTAMIVVDDGIVKKIDTSTSFNSAVAYRSWHPNGDLVAFSSNTVRQFFHTVGENRDVYDKASDIVLYNLKDNTITTTAPISSVERMETYPEWSPDGKMLYFCSSPALESYDNSEHPYSKIKYDLDRISYDAENKSWGQLEKIFSASELDLSVTHPKASPDGRYILFCMSGYGNFTIYKPDSDLHLLDLQTMLARKLDVLNSDKTESYHCWSSNGRWVVFSSKRDDGLCARPYFSYMDESGTFHKPFVLPQKNPGLYEKAMKTYNVPEFVTGPIHIRAQKIARAAWKKAAPARLDQQVAVRHQEKANEEQMWQPVKRK